MNTTPSHVPASAESEEPGGRILETSTSTVATNLSSLQSATTEEVGAAISPSTNEVEPVMHPGEKEICHDVKATRAICAELNIEPIDAFPGRVHIDQDDTVHLVGAHMTLSVNGRVSLRHERLGQVPFASVISQIGTDKAMGMLHREVRALVSEFDEAVRDKRTELVRQNLHRIQEVPNFRLENLPPKRTLD